MDLPRPLPNCCRTTNDCFWVGVLPDNSTVALEPRLHNKVLSLMASLSEGEAFGFLELVDFLHVFHESPRDAET